MAFLLHATLSVNSCISVQSGVLEAQKNKEKKAKQKMEGKRTIPVKKAKWKSQKHQPHQELNAQQEEKSEQKKKYVYRYI